MKLFNFVILFGILVIRSECITLKQKCLSSAKIMERYYLRSVLMENTTSYGRMVMSNEGDFFFRMFDVYNLYVLKKGRNYPEKVKGVDGIANDCMKDNNGNILVATSNGIYKYEPATTSASYYTAKGHSILQLMIGHNNTIYFSDHLYNNFYINDHRKAPRRFSVIHNGCLEAVNGNGDIYFIRNDISYVLIYGKSTPDNLFDIPKEFLFDTAVDRNSNTLFMVTRAGLYTFNHWYPKPKVAEGLSGSLYSIGFGLTSSFFYVGDDKSIYKYRRLKGNPCARFPNSRKLHLKKHSEKYSNSIPWNKK